MHEDIRSTLNSEDQDVDGKIILSGCESTRFIRLGTGPLADSFNLLDPQKASWDTKLLKNSVHGVGSFRFLAT